MRLAASIRVSQSAARFQLAKRLAPQGGEFQVNSYVPYSQRGPAIAMDQDGASEGVFGRLFAAGAGPILDIDADGAVGPLTDGLLVLRSFFGFTGAALVTGAVGGGCTRCTGADVEAAQFEAHADEWLWTTR